MRRRSDLALELAGPHPFFLQIAGFHLYELPARGEPKSPDAYDQAARRFNAEAEDHYRYLWSQLNKEEQQALLSPNMASEALRKPLHGQGPDPASKGGAMCPLAMPLPCSWRASGTSEQSTPTDRPSSRPPRPPT